MVNPPGPNFELLEHTADLGILVRGDSPERLFENAAGALIQIMVRGNPRSAPANSRLEVEGSDLEDLMVRWLGEILYLFEGEGKVLLRATARVDSPHRLRATLETVPFDPRDHEILNEIKAVTYHQIEVKEKAGHWEARIIFDV